MIEIVELTNEHLDKLLQGAPPELLAVRHAYFSPGSAACCLLRDGEPVFAGGIVNLEWHRGEAWILPTRFFREHIKTCLRALAYFLPILARNSGFVRVQATCVRGCSARLFDHLGFTYEGTMKSFGPKGETCSMYARIINP
jgi:hypothetical protein